jgi:rare lipoprotein A
VAHVEHTAQGLRAAQLTILLLLSACSGPAPRPVDSKPSAGETAIPQTSAPAAPKRVPPAPRGGGYYKDDGPGDDIPANLDDIPDAQPRAEAPHRFANKPYVVFGKLYVPDSSVKPFQQQGIASWYGKKFHGQKTSSGEPYDMFAMTAAHPTAAIPSYVRVTNLRNGKFVIVRVTDRGPFHADRIIDLSYAAAYRLGYVGSGSALVEVDAVLSGEPTTLASAQARTLAAPTVDKPGRRDGETDEIAALAARLSLSDSGANASKPAAPAIAQSGTFLQLGAFSNAENAESLRAHLSRELDWLNEGIQISSSGGLFRVNLGPYARRSDAEKVAERIRLAVGYKPAFVTR